MAVSLQNKIQIDPSLLNEPGLGNGMDYTQWKLQDWFSELEGQETHKKLNTVQLVGSTSIRKLLPHPCVCIKRFCPSRELKE